MCILRSLFSCAPARKQKVNRRSGWWCVCVSLCVRLPLTSSPSLLASLSFLLASTLLSAGLFHSSVLLVPLPPRSQLHSTGQHHLETLVAWLPSRHPGHGSDRSFIPRYIPHPTSAFLPSPHSSSSSFSLSVSPPRPGYCAATVLVIVVSTTTLPGYPSNPSHWTRPGSTGGRSPSRLDRYVPLGRAALSDSLSSFRASISETASFSSLFLRRK